MTDEPKKAAPETLQMVRDEPQFPGGPVTADVHPDEVANFQRAGWRLADAAENDNADPDEKKLEDLPLNELKAIATEMGIKFHHNTGAEKLIELIRELGAEK